MLDEQRVREQGADDRGWLSVSRRWRRRWRRRYERTARRRLVLLGPRSDDFPDVFGRVLGRCRGRGRLLRFRLVAQYVGDAERLDAGHGGLLQRSVLARGRRYGPAALVRGRHHHHVDAPVLLKLLLLVVRLHPVHRPAFGREALAVADAVAHLVDLHGAQLLQRFEVIGRGAAAVLVAGRRRVGLVAVTPVAAVRAAGLVQPCVTLGRGRWRWPAHAYVVHVVGPGAGARRSAPRVTAQVGRVTAVVTLVAGGAQRYGFHAIRDRCHRPLRMSRGTRISTTTTMITTAVRPAARTSNRRTHKTVYNRGREGRTTTTDITRVGDECETDDVRAATEQNECEVQTRPVLTGSEFTGYWRRSVGGRALNVDRGTSGGGAVEASSLAAAASGGRAPGGAAFADQSVSSAPPFDGLLSRVHVRARTRILLTKHSAAAAVTL